jgi:hypothetical protein
MTERREFCLLIYWKWKGIQLEIYLRYLSGIGSDFLVRLGLALRICSILINLLRLGPRVKRFQEYIHQNLWCLRGPNAFRPCFRNLNHSSMPFGISNSTVCPLPELRQNQLTRNLFDVTVSRCYVVTKNKLRRWYKSVQKPSSSSYRRKSSWKIFNNLFLASYLLNTSGITGGTLTTFWEAQIRGVTVYNCVCVVWLCVYTISFSRRSNLHLLAYVAALFSKLWWCLKEWDVN